MIPKTLSACSRLACFLGLACLLAMARFIFTGNIERAMLALALAFLSGLVCALLEPNKGIYRHARKS